MDDILPIYEEYNRSIHVMMCSQLIFNLSKQGLEALPEDTYFRLMYSLNSDVIEFRKTLEIIKDLLDDPECKSEVIERYRQYFTPFYEQAERVFNTVIQYPLPVTFTAFHSLIRSTAHVGLSYLRSEVDTSSLRTEDGTVSRRNVLNFYLALPNHLKSSPSSQFMDILNSTIKDSVRAPKIVTLDSPLTLREVVEAFTHSSNVSPPTITQFVYELLNQTKPVRINKHS